MFKYFALEKQFGEEQMCFYITCLDLHRDQVHNVASESPDAIDYSGSVKVTISR